MITKPVEVRTVKMATLGGRAPGAYPGDPLTCTVKWKSYLPKGKDVYIIVVFGELSGNEFGTYAFIEKKGDYTFIWAWGCEYVVETPAPNTETTSDCPTYALDFGEKITPDALVIISSKYAYYKMVNLGSGNRVIGVLLKAYKDSQEVLKDYWLDKAIAAAYDMKAFKDVVTVYPTIQITGFEVKIG